jgi:hypothetical protein
VGQFRSAGGLVLLSGRKLGPKDFLPLTDFVKLDFPSQGSALNFGFLYGAGKTWP